MFTFFNKFLWAIFLFFLCVKPFITAALYPVTSALVRIIFIAAAVPLAILYSPPKFLEHRKILFIFCACLGVSFLPHASSSSAQTALLNYFVMLLLCYVTSVSPREIRQSITKLLLLSGGGIAILSIYVLFVTKSHTLAYYHSHTYPYPFIAELAARERAFFPFFSPNLLASFLGMILLFAIGIIADPRTKNELRQNNFLLLLYPLLPLWLGTFFLTKSIAGWSTFIPVLLIFFSLGDMKITFRRLAPLLIFLLLGILCFRLSYPTEYATPLFSLQNRLTYWNETFQIIQQHPLLGTGPGNFTLLSANHAHNIFLQLWAEWGIIGLLAGGFLCSQLLRHFKKTIKKSPRDMYTLGILSALLFFLLHNLLSFSFFIPQVSYLWWVLLGLRFPPQRDTL